MLIYCPKCQTGYEVEPNMIPGDGKKFRCARCGEIWFCRPEDMVDEPLPEPQIDQPEDTAETPNADSSAEENSEAAGEPVTEEKKSEEKPAELNDIFARLSVQTEELFKQDQALPAPRKAISRLKHILGLDHPGNGKYYLLLFILILLLLLVGFRYDIVRSVPCMESVFSAFGIESRVIGEGLEFQNIVRNEYEEDYVRKLEIKGFIANTTDKIINVPKIHVEIMDKETNIIQSIDEKAPLAELDRGDRMAFRIVINKPSPLAKYVFLTFAK